VAKDVSALAETGVAEAADLPADWKQPTPAQQQIRVTQAVATKRGNVSARRFEGEVIAKAGTLLGHDDGEPVTAPRQLRAGHAVGQSAAAGVGFARVG
jgi:hypothetical protein